MAKRDKLARVSLTIDINVWERIRAYRFENQIETMSEAVEQLSIIGLKKDMEEDRQREMFCIYGRSCKQANKLVGHER